MATFKHTGVGNATARNHYAAVGQIQDQSFTWVGTSAGAADALTLTPSPVITAYAAGQSFVFKSGTGPNTGATTIDISSVGTIAVQLGGVALVGGEILANQFYRITLDTASTCQIENISSSIEITGTWTPVITFATAGDLSVAYTTQLGTFRKVGNRVSLSLNLTTSTFTHTTASGNVQITGIPFDVDGTFIFTGALTWSGITKANFTSMQIRSRTADGDDRFVVQACGSAQTTTPITTGDMPTGGTVIFNANVEYGV